jgi:hypothetical protein
MHHAMEPQQLYPWLQHALRSNSCNCTYNWADLKQFLVFSLSRYEIPDSQHTFSACGIHIRSIDMSCLFEKALNCGEV